MQRLPLTDLPRTLIAAGYEPVSYRAAYNAAVNGAAWAQRGSNGRWSFSPEELGEIASSLHLTRAIAA